MHRQLPSVLTTYDEMVAVQHDICGREGRISYLAASERIMAARTRGSIKPGTRPRRGLHQSEWPPLRLEPAQIPDVRFDSGESKLGGLGIPQPRIVMDDKLPSKSVPGSRRNSARSPHRHNQESPTLDS